ncbi:MAG: hypothetical protein AABW91_04475 [Nanoarchaeota archaeon]
MTLHYQSSNPEGKVGEPRIGNIASMFYSQIRAMRERCKVPQGENICDLVFSGIGAKIEGDKPRYGLETNNGGRK